MGLDCPFQGYVGTVEEHKSLGGHGEHVDRAGPPWTAFFPEDLLDFQNLRPIGSDQRVGLLRPADRTFHKGFQGLLVHHVPGPHFRRPRKFRKVFAWYRLIETGHQRVAQAGQRRGERDRVGYPGGLVRRIIRIVPGILYIVSTRRSRREDLLNDLFAAVVFQVDCVQSVLAGIVAVQGHDAGT